MARGNVDCEERDCGTSKLAESDLKKRVEFVREFDNIEDSEAWLEAMVIREYERIAKNEESQG